MEINDIIEGLNVYYEGFPNRRKGYFVLHKIVDTNPVVKSQKTYRMQVWFVSKGERYLHLVLNILIELLLMQKRLKSYLS